MNSDNEGTLWIEPVYIIMFVGLFLGGFIVAGMAFSELSQRTTGIYYLGVPATHLEKLACSVLYAQVFFSGAYLGIFFLLKIIVFGIVDMYPHLHLRHLSNDFEAVAAFRSGYYIAVLVFAAVQTFYLLGSVYFERFAFVKTTVAAVLIVVAFVLFIQYVISPIWPDHINYIAKRGGYWRQLPDSGRQRRNVRLYISVGYFTGFMVVAPVCVGAAVLGRYVFPVERKGNLKPVVCNSIHNNRYTSRSPTTSASGSCSKSGRRMTRSPRYGTWRSNWRCNPNTVMRDV